MPTSSVLSSCAGGRESGRRRGSSSDRPDRPEYLHPNERRESLLDQTDNNTTTFYWGDRTTPPRSSSTVVPATTSDWARLATTSRTLLPPHPAHRHAEPVPGEQKRELATSRPYRSEAADLWEEEGGERR